MPGTYGTSLLRNHAMQGAFDELTRLGLPDAALTEMKNLMDCNVYFFDHAVPQGAMYGVLGGFALAMVGIYVIMNVVKFKKA